MDARITRQRSRAYDSLALAFSRAKPGLEQEFTRLFLGPGRPVAYPYESVYREGRTMGNTTLDVRRCLIGEGLAPNEPILPDHVSIELAFMSHLTMREARAWDIGEERQAWDLIARQESFLYDHITAWLPIFCRRVLTGRPHQYYADLVRRTEAFVADDVARLQAWLGLAPREASGVSNLGQWRINVGRGCTFCDICVQVCHPGALQMGRRADQGTISLYYEASLCDGCAACEYWCPEKVIRVGQVKNGEQVQGAELARTEMLPCPGCGQLHAPAAMVNKIQAQMHAKEEALAAWIALCHSCRTKDVPWRSAQGGAVYSAESPA